MINGSETTCIFIFNLRYSFGGAPNDQQDAADYESRADAAEDSDVAAERQRVNNSPASVSTEGIFSKSSFFLYE